MGRKKTAEEYNEEYAGKVYGNIRIDEYSHNDERGQAYFWCRCLVCDVRFGPVQLGHLKSGHTTSCGRCSERTEIGNRYGHLIIKELHHRGERGNIYFLCECDCGEESVVRLESLKSGHTTSCGNCSERTEIGNRYGHLVIKELHHKDKNSHAYFLCECDCGNESVVYLGHLKSGHTTSCGYCLERTEIGNRYGHLVIKEFHHRDKKNRYAYFLCECDCGNERVVYLGSLKSGKTTSCGCRTESIGETNIKNILNENNVSYECQKRFEDCKNTKMLPFDFYVIRNGLKWCIEFDGIQHFKPIDAFGGEEGFKIRQQNDQIKNQYCKDNNIPLIRIPHHKRDTMTIDDLMLDSSNYLLK